MHQGVSMFSEGQAKSSKSCQSFCQTLVKARSTKHAAKERTLRLKRNINWGVVRTASVASNQSLGNLGKLQASRIVLFRKKAKDADW